MTFYEQQKYFFKHDGVVPNQSLSQQEYSVKKGERYQKRVPQDSDILKGDMAYTMKTQKEVDYSPKTGERYEVKKQHESDIWKV